jgi:hypothetical protein
MNYNGPLSGQAGSVSSSAPATTVYPPYRGMEYEESEALKRVLGQFVVQDARGRSIKVKTWFRDPEREEREVTYPHILIDFLRMRERSDESHRGYVPFYFEPNTANLLPSENVAFAQFPVPVSLQYQVTTSARVNQHDVMINDLLMTSVLPLRFGQLTMLDGTVRRLDVLQARQDASSLDSDNKRLFRKVWTIEISAEVVPNYDFSAFVTEVEIDVNGETSTFNTKETVS